MKNIKNFNFDPTPFRENTVFTKIQTFFQAYHQKMSLCSSGTGWPVGKLKVFLKPNTKILEHGKKPLLALKVQGSYLFQLET
jgi:hypothetical protein